MQNLKWLKREKCKPFNVVPSDTIALYHRGNVVLKEVIKGDIGSEMVVDEVGIFEAKVEGKNVIGGAFFGKNNK